LLQQPNLVGFFAPKPLCPNFIVWRHVFFWAKKMAKSTKITFAKNPSEKIVGFLSDIFLPYNFFRVESDKKSALSLSLSPSHSLSLHSSLPLCPSQISSFLLSLMPRSQVISAAMAWI
jgi:hypothetical protein